MDHEHLVGLPLVASDGSDIGTVKEIRGDHLKINMPMRRDFWLSTEHIASTDGGVVTLGLRREEVRFHELDAPDGAAAT